MASPFVCPIVQSQIRLPGERERRGIWTAFIPDLGSSGRGEKRAKASCWGSALPPPHVWIQPQTREKFYSKTAGTDPRASVHSSHCTREQPLGEKHCPITRMFIILLPLPSAWGTPARESTAMVGKDQFIPSLASYQFIAALVVDPGPHLPPHVLSRV